MIEQVSNSIKFLAFFVESKLGKTGLTVTIDVYGPDGSALVTGGSATAIGGGLYYYTLSSGSVGSEGEYVAIFKTATTSVDQQHIPALWVVGRAGIENLNASVSAVKAKTDNIPASPAAVSNIPTAAAIADAVWDEAISGHATSGSTGVLLSAAGVASDPLLNTVPGSYASGSAGYALGRIGSGQITTVSPVGTSGDVDVVQGDDYLAADGRAIDWTDSDASWPTLTAATITVAVNGTNYTGSVVTATGDGKKVRLELTHTQTTAMTRGLYPFAVKATLSGGSVQTLVEGKFTVKLPSDG